MKSNSQAGCRLQLTIFVLAFLWAGGPSALLYAQQFALGVEALERFVRHEPLRRVHECVFGVLALESEPVDPRL